MTAPYTRRELESMMADLESDRVERKESLRGDNGQAEPAFRVEPNWVQCTVGAARDDENPASTDARHIGHDGITPQVASPPTRPA